MKMLSGDRHQKILTDQRKETGRHIWLLVCFSLALLPAVIQASPAEYLDPIYGRPEIHSAPPLTSGGQSQMSTAADNGFTVKAVYFVPKNRTVNQTYIQRMKDYLLTCQQFYSMEMEPHGFYKPGTTTGKTHSIETDATGEPIIHIVNGYYNDSAYQDNTWGMVYGEVAQKFSPYQSCIVVWADTHIMHPDGTITGTSCGANSTGMTGGAGGMAIMSSDGLPFLDANLFTDDRLYDGMIIPELGPYPMKFDKTFAWFCGSTIGELASTMFGATAHEMGHTFGLPHCFINDHGVKNGNIMGNGLRGFRGNFGSFPGEYVRIYKVNAEVLNVSPYFNPDVPLTDHSAPSCTTEVCIEEPYTNPVMWKIHVKQTGTDTGSGLYRSWAIAIPPWSCVDSAPFNESGVANYYILPSEIPASLTDSNTFTVEVLAMDQQGNRSINAFWVPAPQFEGIASKVQYLSNGNWIDLPYGDWSPTNQVRLAIAMAAPDTGMNINPEAECRPTGTPCTGNPTVLGFPSYYNGTPVTAYLTTNLPDGTHHYRYRIKTNDGRISGWISKGADDPAIADVRIDTSPPHVPTVHDSGIITGSKTYLTGAWSAVDPHSGIKDYLVAVGTSPTDPGSGYVKDWTVYTNVSATITGLSLKEDTVYYIYVKARNNAGIYGPVGVSDGIRVDTIPEQVTIDQAKSLDDGTFVKINGVVATSGKSEIPNMFYIAMPDRTCGIQISMTQGGTVPEFTEGKAMNITGVLFTQNGERTLIYPTVTFVEGTSVIKPLGLTGKSLGGDAFGLQDGIDGAIGLNNIGLPVRMFGTIISAGADEFTITDGSYPVRVIVPPGVSFPTTGRVTVTGNSSCYIADDGKLTRLIRARRSSDIQPLP
ncbi:MAG TPA: hypothetical protein PLU88_01580 [Armatimonadota bacterium]|nr:hypothetical protein [Armatimonadota bacterium]